MTKSQCWSEISRNEQLITEYEGKMQVLEMEIEELKQTKTKVGELQEQFSSCKSISSSRLENIGKVNKINPKIASRFYLGMSGFLTGVLYAAAWAGMGLAITKIAAEIVKKKNEITKLKNQISACKTRIQQMHNEIARIEAEERRAEEARRAVEVAGQVKNKPMIMY